MKFIDIDGVGIVFVDEDDSMSRVFIDGRHYYGSNIKSYDDRDGTVKLMRWVLPQIGGQRTDDSRQMKNSAHANSN
jgi:hypothetical protein